MVKLVEVTVKQYTVYCDLDGVLVDFDATTERITGINLEDAQRDKKLKREFWIRLARHAQGGKNKVWEDMAPMHDAFQLWNYIKKYNPIILSATGKVPSPAIVAAEKDVWVKKYLGNPPAIFVEQGSFKSQYATPDAILIDDRHKALNPWIEKGGIGVLHTSAANSIKQLQQIGL